MIEKLEVEIEDGLWLDIYVDEDNRIFQVKDSKGMSIDEITLIEYEELITEKLESR